MKQIINLIFSITLLFSISSCTSGDEPMQSPPADENNTAFNPTPVDFNLPAETSVCKGADISWLTQMEAEGIIFRYKDGVKGDCIDVLKSVGINAIRLRVWVNPPSGYCSLPDVLKKAERSHAAGMDIMIDFHYSDDWADPSKQTVPAQWSNMNLSELCDAVSGHTKEVLSALKEKGIEPKWVQVGNETGNGMLWPYGKADTNPKGYAQLVNAGYDAVKAICPDSKVIIHLQNGQDKNLYTWLFDILKTNNARYDVIGMSLYPSQTNWNSMVSSCKENMLYCINRYDKDVMLCEVGMGNSYVTECAGFLRACIQLKDEIPNNRYLGLLYWEPQVYNDWQGYRLGAFTSDGRPGEQLSPFNDGNTSLPSITI